MLFGGIGGDGGMEGWRGGGRNIGRGGDGGDGGDGMNVRVQIQSAERRSAEHRAQDTEGGFGFVGLWDLWEISILHFNFKLLIGLTVLIFL